MSLFKNDKPYKFYTASQTLNSNYTIRVGHNIKKLAKEFTYICDMLGILFLGPDLKHKNSNYTQFFSPNNRHILKIKINSSCHFTFVDMR